MWTISVALLVGGSVCVGVALRGEDLGSPISAGCGASGCGSPYLPVLISGQGRSDLAVWTTMPGAEPGMAGVWARLIDTRSGLAQGPPVQLSRNLAEQGVAAAYNPASGKYLVLWQSGGNISGQLLSDRLRDTGAGFVTPAFDFYLRPGELATDPTGGFLLSAAKNLVGPGTQTTVVAMRISADGQPLNSTSWPVSNGGRQLEFAQAHAAYIPGAREYLVGWSLYGTDGSTIADRMVDDRLSPATGDQTLVTGQDVAGADFALAYEPSNASTEIAWLSSDPTGASRVVGLRLSDTGAPVGTPQPIGQVNAIPAGAPADLGALTLTAHGSDAFASWQGGNEIDTFTIPLLGSGSTTATRTPLDNPGGNYTSASAVNPAARTVAVLRTSNQGDLSGLYAKVTSLPSQSR